MNKSGRRITRVYIYIYISLWKPDVPFLNDSLTSSFLFPLRGKTGKLRLVSLYKTIYRFSFPRNQRISPIFRGSKATERKNNGRRSECALTWTGGDKIEARPANECCTARALNATYAINIVFWLGGKVMPVTCSSRGFVSYNVASLPPIYYISLPADPSLRVRSCKSSRAPVTHRVSLDPIFPKISEKRISTKRIYTFTRKRKSARIDRILILQANYPALSRK